MEKVLWRLPQQRSAQGHQLTHQPCVLGPHTHQWSGSAGATGPLAPEGLLRITNAPLVGTQSYIAALGR